MATENLSHLVTRIPAILHKKLKLHAVRTNTSMSTIVAESLEATLKKAKDEK